MNAFEKNALDYLLKPYTIERFNKSIDRFREQREIQPIKNLKDSMIENDPSQQEPITRIPVKYGTKIIILQTDEILYLEAQDDYVKLVTSKGKYLRQNTMKHFEKRLSSKDFVRIHRSYIVNVNFIKQLEAYDNYSHAVILNDQTRLPVSRSGSGELKKLLNI